LSFFTVFENVVLLRFTEFPGLQDDKKLFPETLTPGR